MGVYRIWVRRDDAHEEFSVVIHDETSRSLAELHALSSIHAHKVARDLMTLVRVHDPDGEFTLERPDELPIV